MSAALDPNRLVLAVTGGVGLAPSQHVLAAAARAGALAVFDLAEGDAWTLRSLAQTARRVTGLGVRVTADCAATPADLTRLAGEAVRVLLLAANGPWAVADLVDRYEVLVEVTSVTEARDAVAAGAAGLVARGMESGGRVSDLSAFVLLQQLVTEFDVPVWVAGGIGPRTAVASIVGGAAGVLLDTQLALLSESIVADDVAGLLRRMDGTEVVSEGERRGLRLGPALLPIGQDGWLARDFADRWSDTASAVRGVSGAVLDALKHADGGDSLRPGAPLAEALGVRIPVAQGPMTRVSDVAGFAAAVAEAGALPFIALALAGGEQTRRMLLEARATLGDRPWGVGVLGFAPEAVRAAQIEAIHEIKPQVAIIAGGRPAQAADLEAVGISSFLHVPSPGLLRQFLRAGSRKFIFEGAECGGHVGPRTSFPLWEAQLAVLEEFLDEQPTEVAAELQIFFAGGIHDERSAAMVAAMTGPLARRGAKAGLLMGTAYLFTAEALRHGAIQPLFQQRAIEATGTALLETAPGHATRCLKSDFVDDFRELRTSLEGAGVANRAVWEQLEQLNVGRLRIASKGLRRDGDALVEVDAAGQAADGLFMAGQVAVLRHAATTVEQLHTQVSSGAAGLHAERVAALRVGLGLDESPEPPAAAPLDIAIVGMACVFAGSPDLAGYWQTILGGVDAITEVPTQRWDPDTYYAPQIGPGETGRYSVSRWGGFIDPVPFDAIRYGIPPAALATIDPTQLIALEISARALTDAGYPYDGGVDHSRTGVVFGSEEGSDLSHAINLRTLLPAYFGEVPAGLIDELPEITEDTFPGVLANVTAGRIANRLDLGGPNFTVDAACASSLAALDSACKELSTGASDMMICGGADLHNGINDYIMFTSAHALSPTGRCRTFDSTGDGIALGEGVAAVVLKRLSDAERDGDRVYAVIKGIGGASDGRALGLTAPRPDGQRRALDRAFAVAGVSPAQVGLVEAHGTGTVVGDRTELETLTKVFTESGAEPGGTVLGSVKSQIGHTKCAAGMAGVIKAALALHTGVRPPTLHLSRPNPAWSAQRSPFAFNTEPRPWGVPAAERLAGVSAFGFGGTNFHVVLGAHAPTADPQHARQQWPAELFLFRGADRVAARGAVGKLLDKIAANPAARLRDLAAEASRGADARSGKVRIAVVAEDVSDLVGLLHRALAGDHAPRLGLIQPEEADAEPGKVAFLFPGQGSQRPGALSDLFVTFPHLNQYLGLGREWVPQMFPPAAFDEETGQEHADRLRDTRVAQPVLGVCGLAVDHLLRDFGVRPDMVGGHSYGELVALCTAGAFDPGTLLGLSRDRAAAILTAAGDDPGTMAAVNGTAEQITEALTAAGLADEVTLANRNAPTQIVISGRTESVERAVTVLTEAGLRARRIPVACAFHSPVVADATESFAATLASHQVHAPGLPVWSNHTAKPYPTTAADVRAGLAAQIGAPVRFVEQIEAMYEAGARVFVEAGPGRVLSGLVDAVLGDRPHLSVAPDGRSGDGVRGLLVAAAELACAGLPVDTGWLFRGRATGGPADVPRPNRPTWTVDGQLVRDRDGKHLTGGVNPPRRIEVLTMSASHSAPGGGHDSRGELVSDFLRTSRELIATQRDVLLAFLGEQPAGGRLVWQDDEPPLRSLERPAAPARTVDRPLSPAPGPALLGSPTVAETEAVFESPAAAAVDVRAAVLSVISDRTGYPEELIELDLDLEADLSVDSIKRAEVAGEVANRLGLSVDGPEGELEELVKARTVRSMVSWLDTRVNGEAGPEVAPVPFVPEAAAEQSPTAAGIAPRRMINGWAPAPAGASRLDLTGARFLITGAATVAAPLADALAELGASGVIAPTGAEPADPGPAGFDGIIVLDGLTGTAPLLPAAFGFLKAALAAGPRWLLAAGPAGGSIGTDGMPGFFRTVAREYPQVVARYVELESDPDAADVTRLLIEEIGDGTPAPIVRRGAGDRLAEVLTPVGLGMLADGGAGPAGDGVSEARAIGLDADSVVVLIGGARGITPWFARTLAGAARCRLELVGRTPLPQTDEDPELGAAHDPVALRGVLARRGMRSPAEIDRTASAVLAAREVAATIAELTELGAQVRYHTLDVRDDEATHRLIKQIQDTHGRIDGVVYAAGIIEDKLIADKDPASFERVFRTKVDGARSVLDALEAAGSAPLFTVMFGSIAAAYGNRGQSDYAAANDALGTLAARWAHRSGGRALTVHWGPWAPVGNHGGMVTAELTAEYGRRGIDLIDPEEGALSLLRELAWGDAAVDAVVLTASGW
ncbi:hypothetical protein GCM10010172_62480 [Paractinoplanes ferrugineus]|uniref:Acyl transferase domain-containing protein n=1 Tax=Paractinoplanes ferrugineus TaxID=113564 RepID=A0A919MDZ8_9ACTN|nr:type I polyketide synthase [Actinoplanes ferrugineus]GIE16336.1 hypothetical protein Afe05nite_81760 [Actinoplanes ferrugineus]